jgi:hypothetical protein
MEFNDLSDDLRLKIAKVLSTEDRRQLQPLHLVSRGCCRLVRKTLTSLHVSTCEFAPRFKRVTDLFIDLESDSADAQLGALVAMPRLQRLCLRGVKVHGIAALSALTQLQHLDLIYCWVCGLRPLSALTKLESLNLTSSRVCDLRELRGLTRLRALRLTNSRIRDRIYGALRFAPSALEPLAALTRLHSLDISGTRVSDLWPLTCLTSLEELNIIATHVSDVSPLSALTRLRCLNLAHCPHSYGLTVLSGLTALSSLTALQRVELHWTDARTAAGLVQLMSGTRFLSDFVV